MTLKTLRTIYLVTLASAPLLAHSAVYRVPQNYPTIQAAIDVAASGDTVRVAAGTYLEHLIIQGKAISLIGAGADSTIIDGNANGRVIAVMEVPEGIVTIAGFTIRNGSANVPGDAQGGGIYATLADLTLRDNVITGNSACQASGFALIFGTLRMYRNRVVGNLVGDPGVCDPGQAVNVFLGGVNYIERNVFADQPLSALESYTDGGKVYIRHNVFRNNGDIQRREWGGLHAIGDLVIDHNLFVNNVGFRYGGAYLNHQEATVGYIRDNSFFGNQAGDFALASAMSLDGNPSTNVSVTNNLMSDSQDFIPEIECKDVPFVIGPTNVFASPVNQAVAGTCTQ